MAPNGTKATEEKDCLQTNNGWEWKKKANALKTRISTGTIDSKCWDMQLKIATFSGTALFSGQRRVDWSSNVMSGMTS